MDMIDREIARRVIAARESVDLTKTDFATKLGMSKQAYQAYESFRTAFTVSQLYKVARVTGMPLATLLGQPIAAPTLAPDEVEMLTAFRLVTSPDLRQMAIRLVRSVATAPDALNM